MAQKEIKAFTGTDSAAYAMKQINPDVVAAYPITPQTATVQTFSSYVADGLVDTELVTVESEHSAMSSVVGAAAAGARSMTATSSAGLALMAEIVGVASGLRLPIVMHLVNRALSAPINIHCDHGDLYLVKDLGWIQMFSENPQEVYDHTFIAMRVAEHPDVNLPAMINQDGFITSHAVERVEVLEDAIIQKFIGSKTPHNHLLDLDNPVTVGPLQLQDYYFETQKQRADAMETARKIIPQVEAELTKLTGRTYGWLESYQLEDAEVAIVVANSTAGTTKTVVDKLRKQGKKVGLLKLRYLRPFPAEQIAEALSHVERTCVMERNIAYGAEGGILFNEVASALYVRSGQTKLQSVLFGMGGRDIGPSDIESIYNGLLEGDETLSKMVGVRE